MTFIKAVRKPFPLKMCLVGVAGAGKTTTSLMIATEFAEGEQFAVIDTERSASKYADQFSFDVCELDTFSPQKYVEAIHEAESAGYKVAVIDGLSQAWNGPGGMLEIVDAIAKRGNGNSFQAWSNATPILNSMVKAILDSPMHIICTMRSKTEYIVEQNEKGKSSPRRVGMAPVQKDNLEFEFDIYGEMDQDHTAIFHKSMCQALNRKVVDMKVNSKKVAAVLKKWTAGAPSRTEVHGQVEDARAE